MAGSCGSCGKPWDDTLFVLACGCTLIGHSESDPARKTRAGIVGSLWCSKHRNWHRILTAVEVEAA